MCCRRGTRPSCDLGLCPCFLHWMHGSGEMGGVWNSSEQDECSDDILWHFVSVSPLVTIIFFYSFFSFFLIFFLSFFFFSFSFFYFLQKFFPSIPSLLSQKDLLEAQKIIVKKINMQLYLVLMMSSQIVSCTSLKKRKEWNTTKNHECLPGRKIQHSKIATLCSLW